MPALAVSLSQPTLFLHYQKLFWIYGIIDVNLQRSRRNAAALTPQSGQRPAGRTIDIQKAFIQRCLRHVKPEKLHLGEDSAAETLRADYIRPMQVTEMRLVFGTL